MGFLIVCLKVSEFLEEDVEYEFSIFGYSACQCKLGIHNLLTVDASDFDHVNVEVALWRMQRAILDAYLKLDERTLD